MNMRDMEATQVRPTLEQIVNDIRDLPSLPAVALELIASLEDEQTGAAGLAEKLACDHALSAKILRLANSSFYGMQGKIGSIQQAVVVLGVKTVSSLVTALTVTNRFSGTPQDTFDFENFWRHSIFCALLSRLLARHLRRNQEQAFIAGMLHDIGHLVLAELYPVNYAMAMRYRDLHGCSTEQAELEIIGIDHLRVGYELARQWHFPAPIQDAIGRHEEMGAELPIASLIHIANQIGHGFDLSRSGNDRLPVLAQPEWDYLNMTQEEFSVLCQEARSQYDDACRIFLG